MKYRRAFRIGLVLTGMTLPALAAEIEHERASAGTCKEPDHRLCRGVPVHDRGFRCSEAADPAAADHPDKPAS